MLVLRALSYCTEALMVAFWFSVTGSVSENMVSNSFIDGFWKCEPTNQTSVMWQLAKVNHKGS